MKTRRLLACIIAASMAFALSASALAVTLDLSEDDIVIVGGTIHAGAIVKEDGTTEAANETQIAYGEEIVIIQNGEGSTGNTIALNGVQNEVTLKSLNIKTASNETDAAIAVEGNATIVIADGTTSTIVSETAAAVQAKSSTLTISGGGTLNATGGKGYAALSTTDDKGLASGSITIFGSGENPAGLTVNATGGEGAAGIGGNAGVDGGTIAIENATVNAVSGENGAGIGGGAGANSGNIEFGGTSKVNATAIQGSTGSTGGAGIGGGDGGSGESIRFNGTMNIIAVAKPADETDTSIKGGAGIGAGAGGLSAGEIVIKDSYVTATGSSGGAGIGGGYGGGAQTNVGEPTKASVITIDSISIVSATGKDGGAGIGAGSQDRGHKTDFDQDGVADGITLNIGGSGRVTATSVTTEGIAGGAGIGGGSTADGADPNLTITLLGSAEINATGSGSAAGIGTGQGSKVNALIQFIGNPEVNASGGSDGTIGGAGVGSGAGAAAVTIDIGGDAKLNATGGAGAAGIGGGANSSGGVINIRKNADVLATGGVYAAGIGSGMGGEQNTLTAGIISILGGATIATGGPEASAIGGGRGVSGGTIVINNTDAGDSPTRVTAHASGDKWAIDLDGTDVSGVENVLNLRLRNDLASGATGVSGNGLTQLEQTALEIVNEDGEVVRGFLLPPVSALNTTILYRAFAGTVPAGTYTIRDASDLYQGLNAYGVPQAEMGEDVTVAATDARRTMTFTVPENGMYSADDVIFYAPIAPAPVENYEPSLNAPTEEIPLGAPSTGGLELALLAASMLCAAALITLTVAYVSAKRRDA